MDTESQRIYDRVCLYRLATDHPQWSQRRYARELGKSPKWVRTWLKWIRPASDAQHRGSIWDTQQREYHVLYLLQFRRRQIWGQAC